MTRRGATWSIIVAILAATFGAAAAGYLVVQLFFLPETLAEQRVSRVPDLSGRDLEDARAQAGAEGYVLEESGRLSWEDVEEGSIIYQIPPPDFYLPQGDTVRVVVSRGPEPILVPRLEGLQPDHASSILRGLGLAETPPRQEFSNLHPQGAVEGTVPPSGTPVEPGTPVTLILSGGGSFLTMPDVRGLGLGAARDTLDLHSLTVGEVVNVQGGPATDDRARVVVSGQEPAPGLQVRRGSAVRLQLGERTSRVRAGAPATAGAPGAATDRPAPAEEPTPRETPAGPQPGDPPADESTPF
ncbi:MAG: PASTA domain-containing protein [Gemmatimonadota bacterium]